MSADLLSMDYEDARGTEVVCERGRLGAETAFGGVPSHGPRIFNRAAVSASPFFDISLWRSAMVAAVDGHDLACSPSPSSSLGLCRLSGEELYSRAVPPERS
jgi:hypothetical protein